MALSICMTTVLHLPTIIYMLMYLLHNDTSCQTYKSASMHMIYKCIQLRGERPPYWTALVQSTYDQKSALSSFSMMSYVLSKLSMDSV